MLHYAGNVEESARELAAVVEILPVESPYYSAVVQSLYLVMIDSDTVTGVRNAIEKLLESEKQHKGVKRRTSERAKLYWAIGGGYARLASLDKALSDAERHKMLDAAADYLGKAVNSLMILRLPLEIAACRSDLAAVLALINPPAVATALDFAELPADMLAELPTEVSRLQEQAKDAAGAIFSADGIAALWAALRSLRDATVAAGAPSPLMAYVFA
jgi:hypothetical protein